MPYKPNPEARGVSRKADREGWDENAEPNPNLVEVFIANLRRQLGSDVVETVRGAGYRLPT